MDTLRGTFDNGVPADEAEDWLTDSGDGEEEVVRELPPEAIGQDERRMQVRAYNHWASLLGDATFPSIEELEPENLTDFGPNSVLLDFSAGIDDPVVQFLGARLAEECGAADPEANERIERLSDVPPRSLLSRITDHYMQILANQAPIGFEAEFVNHLGRSVLYRGILLPFSSDDETIDFIYGVINWKEMADAATADELLLEIDQSIENVIELPEEIDEAEEDQPQKHHADPVTEWADSPLEDMDEAVDATPVDAQTASDSEDEPAADNVSALAGDQDAEQAEDDLPMPDFGQYHLDDPEVDEFGDEIEDENDTGSSYSFASLSDHIEKPVKKALDLDAVPFPADFDERAEEPVEELAEAEVEDDDGAGEQTADDTGETQDDALELSGDAVVEADDASIEDLADEEIADEQPAGEETDHETTHETGDETGLYDCLAAARELAQSARVSEDRSRQALYAAVGRAYDFSLAAQDEPQAYNELIEDSGLTVQERAPMTPIVKLVFGHDYDKTRLTEYAAVLNHAHRMGLERGSLAQYLGDADGGLKGVVAAERRLRREESGKEVEAEGDVRAQLARKLRELDEILLEAIDGDGPEFSLVMLRRDGNGNVALIGEVADDLALIERAGKRLVRQARG